MFRFVWRLLIFSSCSGLTAVQAADFNPEMANMLDIMWLVMAAMIVFFMQTAFALLESGMSRAKNAVNVMMKNYFDVCIALLMFSLTGYCMPFKVKN